MSPTSVRACRDPRNPPKSFIAIFAKALEVSTAAGSAAAGGRLTMRISMTASALAGQLSWSRRGHAKQSKCCQFRLLS